jgi:predicted nuclease with TOPRIM domain
VEKLMIASGLKTIPLLLGVSLLLSCSPANEDQMKEKQLEIKSELENSIAETEAAIQAVEQDLESAGEEMRASLDTRLARLEDNRDDLRDKLDRVGDTTADEWDEFEKSVRRSVDNARQTLREV